MATTITPEDREDERLLFDTERKRTPELFLRQPMIDDEAILRHIGIEGLSDDRPIGYLKLFSQDFIVEEISRDGIVHTIDLETEPTQKDGEGATYYADLVKIGISTLEAKNPIAELIGLDEKNIGYAGIKDKAALTSQLISLRGMVDPEKISTLDAENFFLKNLRRGKGVMANGDLQGNRFTITLRMPEPISEKVRSQMEQKLEESKVDGFWNFFYLQRFGTPRLLSHLLGRLIVKGQYEATVKLFCTHSTSPRELPYFSALRQAIERQWGDWNTISTMIDLFPYHFHLERCFIDHLKTHPADFLGALHTLPDQIRLWIYAYDCYLFNRKLSELIKQGEVPLSLPLITSFNPLDWKPYQKYLEEDNIRLPSRAYRDFPFIRIESRHWPTLQKLEIHSAVFQERFVVFSFSLPKGSYATTFLMNFFKLATGLPIVPGIFAEPIDSKGVLGQGTLAPVLERFKTIVDARTADLEASAEE